VPKLNEVPTAGGPQEDPQVWLRLLSHQEQAQSRGPEAVERGLKFAYVARKNKKRDFLRLCESSHQRLRAAQRPHFLQPVCARLKAPRLD